jgi:hypothetical protein
MMPRNNLFPPRRVCTMHFGESLTLSAPDTNLCTSRAFALNGIAVCDLTSASGTPYDYARAAVIYNRYFVRRARFSIKVFDPDVEGILTGVQLRGPTPTGLSIGAVLNRPGTASHAISNTGDQFIYYKGEIDCAQAMGLTQALYQASSSPLIGANPGSSDFTTILYAWFASTVGSTAIQIKVDVDIQYDVVLFDPIL